MNISAVMTVRDEPWLEPSAFSIDRIADELIIVDASTHDISDEVRDIDRQTSADVVHEKMEPDLKKQSLRALQLASNDHLIRWDGDMVAFKKIDTLVDVIEKAPRYYTIHSPVIDLGTSFFKTSRTQPGLTHSEPYVFSNSWFLRTDWRPKKIVKRLIDEFPPRLQQHPFPVFYKNIYLDEPLAIHLRGIKPEHRRKEKFPQSLWANLNEKEKKEFDSFEDFVDQSTEEMWSLMAERVKKSHFDGSLDCFKDYWEKDVVSSLNVSEYDGPYPEMLKQWVEDHLGVELEDTHEFRSRLDHFLEGRK